MVSGRKVVPQGGLSLALLSFFADADSFTWEFDILVYAGVDSSALLEVMIRGLSN